MNHFRLLMVVGGVLIGVSHPTYAQSAQTQQEQPISDKSPSAEINSPVPLELGEVVKGRLGDSDQSGKFQYWLVNFPVGNFKAVLDVRRADLGSGFVGGNVQWFSTDGEKLGLSCDLLQTLNEVRWREICSFTIKKPLKAVLRYSNKFTVSDYWLGIFKADAPIQAPFFYKPPTVLPLKLNETVTATINGRTPERDTWYSLKLKAGDYKLSAEYRDADGQKGIVGGRLTMFGTEGEYGSSDEKIETSDFSVKSISRLSLADDKTIYFRISASGGAYLFGKERIIFSVEPATE